jgi:hypothetical protein
MASAMLMTAAHGALYVFYSIHLVSQGYGKTLVGFLWTLGVVAEIFVFLWMPRISHPLFPARRAARLLCPGCVALCRMIGWGVAFIGFWCWRSYCTRRASAPTTRRRWPPSTTGLRRASRRGRRRSTAALPTVPAVLVVPCSPAGCGKPGCRTDLQRLGGLLARVVWPLSGMAFRVIRRHGACAIITGPFCSTHHGKNALRQTLGQPRRPRGRRHLRCSTSTATWCTR